jgi:hypothetical protein
MAAAASSNHTQAARAGKLAHSQLSSCTEAGAELKPACLLLLLPGHVLAPLLLRLLLRLGLLLAQLLLLLLPGHVLAWLPLLLSHLLASDVLNDHAWLLAPCWHEAVILFTLIFTLIFILIFIVRLSLLLTVAILHGVHGVHGVHLQQQCSGRAAAVGNAAGRVAAAESSLCLILAHRCCARP